MDIFIVCCHWYGGCQVSLFDDLEKAYDYMKNDFEEMLSEYDYTQNGNQFFDEDGNDISNEVYITERTATMIAPKDLDSKLFWEITVPHCTDIK